MILTPAQLYALTRLRNLTIWVLIFIAGYEWAHLCDWLDRGGMVYD